MAEGMVSIAQIPQATLQDNVLDYQRQGLENAKNRQDMNDRRLLSQIASANVGQDGQLDVNRFLGAVASSPVAGDTKVKLVQGMQPMAKQQAISKALADSHGDMRKFISHPLMQGYQEEAIKILRDTQAALDSHAQRMRERFAETAAQIKQAPDTETKQHIYNVLGAELRATGNDIDADKNAPTTANVDQWADQWSKPMTPEEQTKRAADIATEAETHRSNVANETDKAKLREIEKEKLDIEKEKLDIELRKALHPTSNASIFKNDAQLYKYVDDVAHGRADPSLSALTTRGVEGAKARIDVLAGLQERYPDFYQPNAIGDNKYWNSASVKQQLQAMNVVDVQLPKLKEASDEMKRLGIPVLDEHGIKNLRSLGNTDAANYIGASVASVEDLAKALARGNALTNDQLALAKTMVPVGSTPAQLDKIFKQLQDAVLSRKLTVYKMGGVYGKIAAREDQFLDEATRQQILEDKTPPAKASLPKVSNKTDWDKVDFGKDYIDTKTGLTHTKKR